MHAVTRAGLVLGIGLGGFFDGIVLHQILGWHHLICRTETCQPETVGALLQQNREDGFFHLAMWIATVAGIFLLAKAARTSVAGSNKLLSGGLLIGWGAFNFLEGLIDHHLLRLHQVRPGHPDSLMYDLLFLASGLILAGLGVLLTRRSSGSVR